jgi:hypothetical protein
MSHTEDLRVDPETAHVENLRALIERQYEECPTGCGGSFGEILCWELHSNGLTFVHLAEKWGVSLPTLGTLIADHCHRLEAFPRVNHAYRRASAQPGESEDFGDEEE